MLFPMSLVLGTGCLTLIGCVLCVIARELIPFGGGLGGTLQQFAWSEALQSFLFTLQWTIVTMFSTHVTIYHHLISQAGWNRCNLSIYLSRVNLAIWINGSHCWIALRRLI